MSRSAPTVANNVVELRSAITALGARTSSERRSQGAAGARVGFVPTMGFLHEGHATLVRRARAECDVVVVSIFVNPLQFGAGEDFMSYPRDLERDLALLAAEGTDVVFVPQATEFYPQGADTAVVVGAVAQPLEGAFRPGHFRGVATVVTMLFNAAQATVTYFGEKDWQQLLVVRQLVRDLHMPIDVVGVPTTRESDGLAMSSRNVRLGESDRATALSIPRALEAVRAAYVAGERSVGKLERAMERVLSRATGLRIDYAVIVDAHSLRPAAAPDATLRALIAGRVGGVRLIDNCGLE